MFTDTCSRVVVRPLVVLLLVVCSVEGDYTPQCHKDCSWENWKGDVQICSQNNTMGRINDKKSLCPNFFQSSLERDEPVEPIQNVSISHYSATYTYPDGRVYEHTVTGLNISFDVDPAGLGLYTGAIIEIIGVKHQAFHFDKLGCFYLNFHGTLNNSTLMLSMNKTKRMFFDCARSLAPDSTYQITIKMAPFTSKPAISRYTIPSCFYSPNDFFCKVPEEEMARVWTPETFEVDVSRDKEVVLVFNLAPFAFNHYKVWLQEARLEYGKQVNLGKQEPCVDIYVENNTVTDFSYCSQPHNFTITWKTSNTKLVTVRFTGVKPATYIVELLPWPLGDNSQKCLKNDISFQCTVMSSKPSEVKVHPKEEDDYNVPTIPTLQESQGFKHDEQGNVVAIAIASLCSVLVAALVSLIIYKSKKRNDQDIYHIDEEDNEDNKSIRVKRIFVVHSFDHPSHNNVVLNVCNFLSNCCKFDVHTALYGSNAIEKGVNEWIARECEEADKIIVICSQGTQLKWRANYRDISMQTKEEACGDIFSIFLRVQRVEYEKNPEKFVVAYMSYSFETDIPQPLTSLMKYQLMDHMEQMYYHLNGMKKQSATHVFNIPALQSWASATDAGVDLEKAIDEMKKKIEKEDDWFFNYNEIPDEIAVRLKAKQQRVSHPINNEVKIFRKSEKCSLMSTQSNLMHISLQDFDFQNISKISDDEFQLASLASLKQITGFRAVTIEQPKVDSGVSMCDSGISISSIDRTKHSNFMSDDFVHKQPTEYRSYLHEYRV